MKITLRTAVAALLLCTYALAVAQLSGTGSGSQLVGPNSQHGRQGNGPPPPGQTEFDVWNLIGPATVTDPLTGATLNAYRPMLLNLDGFTIRNVLTANGVDANDPNLILQVVGIEKKTMIIKCDSALIGYGAGKNGINNFFKDYVAVKNDKIDWPITKIVFSDNPDDVFLGDRALLYTNPGTYYTLWVTYVVRLPNGRISPPETRFLKWTLRMPTLQDIKNYIDYFRPVAAGLTQKPKITADVQKRLNDILDSTVDPLQMLIDFETAVATYSLDFSVMAGADDARFFETYMIDSAEEPYQCTLIEMANALLFH